MADTVLERRACKAGEAIFSEGEPGTEAFIIQSGEVQIVKIVDGEKVVLGTMGKGGIFGEMALVDDATRMATAKTTQASTLIVVSREMFEQKMAKTDPFVRGLMKIFAETIRNMSSQLSKSGAGAAAAEPATDAPEDGA